MYSVVYVCCGSVDLLFFFFKQKTAYEMRISDWSSDVCSSDLSTDAGLALVMMDLRSAKMKSGRSGCAARPHGDQWSVEPAGFRCAGLETGKASCRERGCHLVEISGVAYSLQKHKNKNVQAHELPYTKRSKCHYSHTQVH